MSSILALALCCERCSFSTPRCGIDFQCIRCYRVERKRIIPTYYRVVCDYPIAKNFLAKWVDQKYPPL
jgi:hypothetical protein